VSAFGVGGTNVHVVLEQPPGTASTPEPSANGRPQLIVLSARSAAALDAARIRLAAHLREHPTARLEDIAYSLQLGRRAFDYRSSIVARDTGQALAKLESGASGIDNREARRRANGAVVFMFPGQGAQYPGMGQDLFQHEPVFRQHIERCAAVLKPLMTDDLISLLYPTDVTAQTKQRLMSTIAAQPAIFSVEYALANLWMSWGIKPTAMIGHSIGEFVAAVIAGVFSLEDALKLVAARGRLMQELPAGAMLAVRLPEPDVLPLLTQSLNLAAVNGPGLCVVAGPFAAVDELEKSLTARDVVTRRLHTSHAFHSAMVEPVVEPLRRCLREVALSAPRIPYVSCVTGEWIRPEQATSPDYWARHAREPVRFADGIATAGASENTILIEVGPGTSLSTLATQAMRGRKVPVVSSMQDSAGERDDRDCLLDAVGRAWTHGALPDWAALHDGSPQRVPLPTYPFERSRYWIDAPKIDRGPVSAAVAAVTTVAAAADAPNHLKFRTKV